MLLRETTRKIAVDIRRNPTIRFIVLFFVDLAPMRATEAASAINRIFTTASDSSMFRPDAAEIPRIRVLPSVSPARSATTDVAKSVRLRMTLTSTRSERTRRYCVRYDRSREMELRPHS